MMTLTYIFGALVLLGLCIFVHELGHLLGGRTVGIKAKVFSMGYGKGVLKKKIGDTTYQVTLIPFGGYCQFYGEEPGEDRSGDGFEFLSAHPLKRIVTVAMGPIFNLIFGIILFYMMNMIGYTKETNRIMIPAEYVSSEYTSPAYSAGLRTGDTLTSINKREVKAFSDIQTEVFFSEGRKIDVTALRDGRELSLSVQPLAEPRSGRYTIGVMPLTKGIGVTNLVSGGAADKSGIKKDDIINRVDGAVVYSPSDFSAYLQKHPGKKVNVHFLRKGVEKSVAVVPSVTEIFTVSSGTNNKQSFVGDEEFKRSVAKGAVRVDGKPMLSYGEFVKDVGKGSGRSLIIDVGDKRYEGKADILRRSMIGIGIGFVFDTVEVKYGPGEGLVQAFVEPWEFIVMNVKGVGMLFSGKMDVRENLSGPIRIAKIAGDVLYYRGISDFILLMAKISIILMIMNLLPIPAVDGSHLVFYIIEAVRGKPLNEALMARIQAFGVFFLILLGVFVIINDISMLPFVQDLFK